MHNFSINIKTTTLLSSIIIMSPNSVMAQEDRSDTIIVNGTQESDTIITVDNSIKGPEIKGIISAQKGNRFQVLSNDGTRTTIAVNANTKVKASKGFLGLNSDKLPEDALLTGLPVTVKTMQSNGNLFANQIKVKNKDLKIANMIHTGTAQGFAEQRAATDALRSRVSDIDQYNIKSTTNVNFDTGKAALSFQDKSELCATASQAEATDNALLLVVGYTDSTGPQELNQRLSEKRATNVVNYLQQACGWKPYRMLTPTGMAKADPIADNDTPQGKAQNRRVAVNILVSKGLDGL